MTQLAILPNSNRGSILFLNTKKSFTKSNHVLCYKINLDKLQKAKNHMICIS